MLASDTLLPVGAVTETGSEASAICTPCGV